MKHTYPPHRAGYWNDEEINLPAFPVVLYSAICSFCLKTVVGPASGIVARNEGEGDAAIFAILDNHVCNRGPEPDK